MRSSKRGTPEPIDVVELTVSGEEFAKLPPAERHVALFYGHIANDIVTMRRLLLLSIPSSRKLQSRPKIYREFYNQQAFGLMRILAGKTYEGWEAINREVDGIRARREMRASIDRIAPTALDECGRYFGRKNAVKEIRDGFAFHMLPDRWLSDGTDALTAVMGFQAYVRDGANSLYGTSEHLLMFNLLACCGKPIDFADDPKQLVENAKGGLAQFNVLIEEVLEYGDKIVSIINAIVMAMFEKMKSSNIVYSSNIIKIRDVSLVETTSVPVFLTMRHKAGNAE